MLVWVLQQKERVSQAFSKFIFVTFDRFNTLKGQNEIRYRLTKFWVNSFFPQIIVLMGPWGFERLFQNRKAWILNEFMLLNECYLVKTALAHKNWPLLISSNGLFLSILSLSSTRAETIILREGLSFSFCQMKTDDLKHGIFLSQPETHSAALSTTQIKNIKSGKMMFVTW